MLPFTITTSWDDGHRLDLRLADLLDKYGVKATFYIAKDYLSPRLTEPEIRQLAIRHEIGAHTMTHPVLTQIAPDVAQREIADSRAWLQQVIGTSVTSFCYPKGQYNTAIRQIVAEAGYTLARTVQPYQLTTGDDPLTTPTTIHLYPFPMRPGVGLRARYQRLIYVLPHVRPLHLSLPDLRGWLPLAEALLARTAQVGGVWHLWGHSWEIEKYDLWDDLERILQIATRYTEAQPVTNSALISR